MALGKGSRSTRVEQLVTPRTASRLTALPWSMLRAELEANGYRIVRIAGRERVAERDLMELIAQSRQPTLAETADRIGLAIDLAAAEMGIARRSRRRGKGQGKRRTDRGDEGHCRARGGSMRDGVEHDAAEANHD